MAIAARTSYEKPSMALAATIATMMVPSVASRIANKRTTAAISTSTMGVHLAREQDQNG